LAIGLALLSGTVNSTSVLDEPEPVRTRPDSSGRPALRVDQPHVDDRRTGADGRGLGGEVVRQRGRA
jgi:hypothetical protein